MASLALGSLCKPTSFRRTGVVGSSSSLPKGGQSSKFMQISKFDNNGSMTLQQRNRTIVNEQFTLHQKNIQKFKLNVSSTSNSGFDATHDLSSPMESAMKFVNALYRFIRPYAAVGTVLSVAAMSLLTVQRLSDFSPLFFTKMLQALVGGMFMQMYVCGFNQICDIELDKVNKPTLPLAAGEISMNTAIIVSSVSAIMSLAVGWIVSPPLFWAFVGWFVVGTAYSANVLPYLRWKRFPFTAAFYMLMARALVVPIGYYLHMQSSLHGVSTLLSRPILFAVAMLSAFSVSTIFFKMYWICIWILEIAYLGAACVGATSPVAWSKYVTIGSHLAMALLLWVRVKSVDLKNMEAVQSMYMFLWQLFYAKYGLIALVR